jgi:hypothetical protein
MVNGGTNRSTDIVLAELSVGVYMTKISLQG